MRLKNVLFGFIGLSLLACSTVTNLVLPPTATPVPTATATLTASPTSTQTLTPVVPAYVPPECASAPLATLPPVAVATPTLATETNPEITRENQLKILEDLGSIVQEVYVYPDYNGKDWNEIQDR